MSVIILLLAESAVTLTNVDDLGVNENEVFGAARDDENLPTMTPLATDVQGGNRGSLCDEGMFIYFFAVFIALPRVAYFTRFLEPVSPAHSAKKMTRRTYLKQSSPQPGAAVDGVVSREECQPLTSAGEQEDGRLIIDEGS